ncbi:MAG: hypothetical protein KGH72_01255 [Candidatus Micrarchaeota archaeon]|nr:hypothetical protein [Candidatus Micrarchaeota archaeon]
MAQKSKLLLVCVLLVSTSLASIGQLLFKLGLSQAGAIQLVSYVCLGIIVYGMSIIAYFYALGRTHLSWGYGFTGLSYAFTALLAYLVLGETIGSMRALGIIAIVIGTVVIGVS